ETIRRFRLIGRGQGGRIHWFESGAGCERFNAQSVARVRRLGLRPLLRRMEVVHADLVQWFERLPTESLRDPSHAYPVVEWLPAPGWRHEQEHLGEIRAWWHGRRKARARQPPVPRSAVSSKRRCSVSARRTADPGSLRARAPPQILDGIRVARPMAE